MIVRRVRTALAVGVVLAAVAGCSSAGPAPGRSGGSSDARSSATAQPAPPASTVPTGPTSGPTSAAPSATASPVAPSTSAAPPTLPPPVSRSTCRSLTIRVIRGSAAPGYEFAALQFVNTSSTRCELFGYPTVTLRLRGAPVGRPSSPSGAADSHFVLAPGGTAESRLQDFSACQAPLSDEIRVVAPGSSISASRPGQLRACSLRVSALGTPE